MSKTAAHAPRAVAPQKPAAARKAAPVRPAAAKPAAPRRSLWQWLRALFSDQLRVQRSAKGVAVVLQPKTGTPAQPAAASAAASHATQTPPANDMRRELSKLLDAVPNSRSVLRHLAAVETGLRKDGEGQFLFDVDIKQLHVALRQLASLGIETHPTPGLALLSTRLLDAIAEQEKRAQRANGAPVVSSFLVEEESVEVAEVEVSRFEQMFAGAPGAGPKG
jgi:hypothetical protein